MPGTPRLSPHQVAAFRRDGYLLFHEQVFSPERLEQLSSTFEELLAKRGAKQPDELDTPHFQEPRLLDFLLDDAVLNLVEPIVGPNIGLWSSHFICKQPRVGRATPWHEDSAYWKGFASTMENIVTVWLALDRATRENGCMRVIPGSHAGGFSDYEQVARESNTFGSQIKPGTFDEATAVYFELERGECSLHEARIIHGAAANTSNTRRTGYTMRYFPTSTHIYLDKIYWEHKLWLARGRDLAGNTYVNG